MAVEMSCPSCAKVIAKGLDVAGNGSGPGTVVVCLRCRALSVITEHDTLRHLTDDEMDTALADPTVNRAIRIVADYHREHGVPTGDTP